MKFYFLLKAFQKSNILVKVKLRNVSGSISRLNGLLSGIHDVKEADFYSNNISIKSAYELLKHPNQIYSICLHNAGGNTTKLDANLKNIHDNAINFVESNEVWNRKELIVSLENIIVRNGKFVCLLAGKNTGKSLVLNHIEKKYPERIFKLNLRRNSDMLTELIRTARGREKLDKNEETKTKFLKVGSKIVKRLLLNYTPLTEEDLERDLNTVLNKPDPGSKTLSAVIEDLVENLGPITLVIDEANIALTITDTTTPDKIVATKEALALFTTWTKEQNKVYTS